MNSIRRLVRHLLRENSLPVAAQLPGVWPLSYLLRMFAYNKFFDANVIVEDPGRARPLFAQICKRALNGARGIEKLAGSGVSLLAADLYRRDTHTGLALIHAMATDQTPIWPAFLDGRISIQPAPDAAELQLLHTINEKYPAASPLLASFCARNPMSAHEERWDGIRIPPRTIPTKIKA